VLKVRVIPTLLWKDFGLVKGVRFDSWRRVGSVLPAIKVYNARDVDELVLVDITASAEQRSPDHQSVSEFADECFVPLTVGGGISTHDQIVSLLHAGADKVALNSVLYEQPDLVDRAAGQFGSQCVVASVDVRRDEAGQLTCLSHAGARATGREPVAWVRELADRGAGEILLTSVDRDGTMSGYDLDLIAQVADAVGIPVIASGGAGSYDHLVAAVGAGATAVAAASMFHFTEQTPAGAKDAMRSAGIPVRQHLARPAVA
jgi:cyclase